jgi:hypothetical protein
MDFIPEKFALEVDEICVDKRMAGTLAFTTRQQRSERRECCQRRG